MELLEAVNTVLPYLGEHKITDIDTTRHPTVDLIVNAIDRARKELIASGWYFNDAVVNLGLNTDGQIDAPDNTLSIYGYGANIAVRDGRLFDLTNNTKYFTTGIQVRLIYDVQFEDLPYYAAAACVYAAALEVYTADFGMDNTVQILDAKYDLNKGLLIQENLRNRNYNTERTVRYRSKAFRSTIRFR